MCEPRLHGHALCSGKPKKRFSYDQFKVVSLSAQCLLIRLRILDRHTAQSKRFMAEPDGTRAFVLRSTGLKFTFGHRFTFKLNFAPFCEKMNEINFRKVELISFVV